LVPIALALTYERTVAKMRATHRKLRHLADIDVLTRLPNRRHFHELAARSLATTEPATAAVLMFDIENLKRINDLLGQATGDEALRQVGLALRETLRNRDVAGRLGGDEFAALLPDTTVADAVRVASRISDHLQDRQVAPRTARLTLNVGAVQMRAGDTIIEALRRADIALDDARSHTRGRPVSAASLEDTVTLPRNAQLEPKAV
ncbi:MAG TPA: GGDEF domain-containing protein, partial [Caldimonas sp.]